MTGTASLHSAQQVGYTSIDHITLNNGHILNIDKVSLRDNSLYLETDSCVSPVQFIALCVSRLEKLPGFWND